MSPHRKLPFLGPSDHRYPAHAKIVATLGPASEAPDMVSKLIENGVNIFRLNFSHGDLDEQLDRLRTVRRVADGLGRPIAVLGDLQGPKMRVGPVPDLDGSGGVEVRTGDDVLFKKGQGDAELVPGDDDLCAVFGTTFNAIFSDVEPGQRVLVNDGAIRMLAVERKRGEELRCRVTHGGKVTSNKGINLPESDLSVPAITERDWTCVEWGVRHGVDFFALSFVRTPDEILTLKRRLRELCAELHCDIKDPFAHDIPVVAKIEKPQALVNLEAIVEVVDGIMVARGDLGVEMEVHQVPVAQKHIVEMCAEHGRPCIVATQMLETMIEEPAPTRAEASDVANAIFDGADAVMLSGETAVGKHPDLVVETMARIVRSAEDWIDHQPHEPTAPSKLTEYPFRSAALAAGAWHITKRVAAKLCVVWSQSGGMARYLSQHDFRVPVVAFTSSDLAARRMALFGGVTPIRVDPPGDASLAAWTDQVEELIIARGWVEEGDPVVLCAGKPLGSIKAQDILAILRVGDSNSGFRGHDDEPDPRMR
ncbi:MAG: pyruvate kinase [Planctomycetota bacterium]